MFVFSFFCVCVWLEHGWAGKSDRTDVHVITYSCVGTSLGSAIMAILPSLHGFVIYFLGDLSGVKIFVVGHRVSVSKVSRLFCNRSYLHFDITKLYSCAVSRHRQESAGSHLSRVSSYVRPRFENVVLKIVQHQKSITS